MNRVKRPISILFIIVSLFLTFSQTAYASVDAGTFDRAAYPYYIDPGTGSIIIQVLIGAFVGGLALIGVYRIRVKNFFANLFVRRRQGKQSEQDKESEERE